MKKKRVLNIGITAVIIALVFTACKDDGNIIVDDEGGIHASITLAGSTSMSKLCDAMSESFMKDNPNSKIMVEYTGTGAGIEALTSGFIDIANASRPLKAEEIAKGNVENLVAIDAIAVVVNRKNKIKALSSDELSDIYKGKYRNWKELGGRDEPIVIIGREAGSGTRGAFEELLGIEEKCRYSQELDSTGGVLAKVMKIEGAIGYISLDVLDDEVRAMAINGYEPTEENILEKKYILSRPFIMATKGELQEQSELVKAWFSYIKSEEGRAIIRSVGLINPKF